MKVKITLLEEMLGMSPAKEDIFRDYIGSKAPDAAKLEDEVSALGVDAVEEKEMMIFPKDENGTPFVWDYQMRGAFKDAIGMLSKAGKAGYKGGKACAGLKAYKKAVDGLIFVNPRKILINVNGTMGTCSRRLRASTPMGERISLAKSETVPAGSTFEFEVILLDDSLEKVIRECLDYGNLRGFGGWRNSGKGIFEWEEIK